MRVAVTYDNGNVFEHFGRTEQFKVYDIEDGKVVNSQILGTDGEGCGALAGILRLLLQSEFDESGNVMVKLLPALPENEAWQSGFVRGAAIKGGYTLDFEWKNGKVVNFKLHNNANCVEESRIKISGLSI